MRTERLMLFCLGLAGSVQAQEVRFDRDTQVRQVTFEVADGLSPAGLEGLVATRGRGGLVGLRQALRWLPLVPEVAERPFNPVELQRDKERLRRHFSRLGYPETTVDYQVERVGDENAVDVLFRIAPGPPLVLVAVDIVWDPSGPRPDPSRFLASAPVVSVRVGEPLDQGKVEPTAASIQRWLADRGYAFATVEPEVMVDSVARRASVSFRTRAGPRTRIGSIEIVGNERLPTHAIRRLLDARPGDWYSPDRLLASGQRIAASEMVSRATFEPQPAAPGDSVLDLVLRVHELPPRRLVGQAGYTTDGGIAGEATWSHSNILGGAQTLTADLSAQSGALALSENPEQYVRASVSLRLPVRGRANLALDFAPYVEYRDDFHDRSVDLGIETTLLYQLAPLSSIAVRHHLATRRIYEYRFGDIAAGLDFLELLRSSAEGLLDTLGARIGTHTVSVSAVLGSLDSPTDPTRGAILEPTLTATIPGALTATEYLSATIRASGYLPISRSASLAARIGGGKLYPMGKSVPTTQADGLRQFLRLRDVVFTAGGAADVRGWAGRQLGPKLPQFVITPTADSGLSIGADRYVPLGGFNVIYASLELRLPLPLAGPKFGVHTFVDAGRVWTHDERFTSSDDPYGVEKLFWATGVGVDYTTPIGAIRLGLGYKLNPSPLDLATAEETAQAILDGTSLLELPRHPSRRFQLLFGFGRRL